MPNEQKIRSIVQDEIRRSSGGSRFGVQNVQYHTHNGIDSKPVFSPTITYVGKIPQVPIASFLQYFLPIGWSVELFGATGEYRITHNLNTTNYAVTLTPYTSSASSQDVMGWVSIDSPNYFSVYWYDSLSNDGRVDFFFQLTQFDNRTTSLSKYQLIET